jgi:hypothetical protein
MQLQAPLGENPQGLPVYSANAAIPRAFSLTTRPRRIESAYVALQQKISGFQMEIIMDPKAKSPSDAPEAGKKEAPDASSIVALATLMHKGIERAAEIQKSSLSSYAQQTAEAVAAGKSLLPSAAAPGMYFADVAGQGMTRLIETQKGIADLLVQQSGAVLNSIKQPDNPFFVAAGMMADMVRQTTEMVVAAHKTALGFAAEQNRAVTTAIKRQSGVAGTPAEVAVDSVQKTVNAIIDTQKELVEIAGKPLKAVVGA